MFLLKCIALSTLVCASAAMADPLADMDGTWRGSGWAKETQSGPQETLRCKITNTYDATSLTLKLSGQCVVPSRRLTLSGTLAGSKGTEKITGRWSNPDGLGSTRITGIQRDDIVAFTFKATDPVTGRALAQNIEWRVSDGTLRLRATDRKDPTIMMSDITFTP